MKKIYTYLFLLAVIGSLQAQKSWTSVAQVDLPLGIWNPQVFAFKDGINHNYTTDGGATIQSMGISVSNTELIGPVHYLNQNELFTSVRKLIGGSISCWVSSDGGANFTKMGGMTPAGYDGQSVQQMYFFDANHGVAMLKLFKNGVVDLMVRTTDGGATWSVAHSDTLAFDDYEDVTFTRSGMIRVFVGNDLYESTDQGATWTVAGTNPLYSSGNFVDDGGQNIWGVGWAGTQNPCYVNSTDGGSNFNNWNIPDENNGGIIGCGNSSTTARDLAFVAPDNLMVVGFRASHQDRVTIISEDGGSTWMDATFPSGFTLNSAMLGSTDDGSSFYCWDAASKDLFVTGQSGGVGNNELPVHKFEMYPNPANIDVTIKLPDSPIGKWKLKVLNSMGQFVFETTGTEREYILGLEALPAAGAYIVSISSEEGTFKHQERLVVTQ